MAGVSRSRWSGHFVAAIAAIPSRPMRPPTAAVLRCAGKPVLSSLRKRRVQEILRLWIGRWIHDALDVATRGEHEVDLATQDMSGLIAGLPGCDVVGDPGDDVGGHPDLRHVDRCAQRADLAGDL